MSRELEFRDVEAGRALAASLARVRGQIPARELTVMHVCGSHEQALARFGLRSLIPANLELIMGPGCPVCVTDGPEIDEGVALALQGVTVATYGDMLRVPGSAISLADARAEGASVHVVYSVAQAAELAARRPDEEVVFFATGFETTAVATAAVLLASPPPNFSVLSAHKYVPAAMEVVAQMPTANISGFLAAGHAATITGWGVFEPFVERYRIPVSVAGFEPLDILAAIVRLLEMIRDGAPSVVNAYPRCVTREGNRRALELLFRVFRTTGGEWRGIAEVPNGSLRLRDEWVDRDARHRFRIDLGWLANRAPRPDAAQCLCGDIMAGIAKPPECPLFGTKCVPDAPVGACMVSSEGTCRIWYEYGGRPDLESVA